MARIGARLHYVGPHKATSRRVKRPVCLLLRASHGNPSPRSHCWSDALSAARDYCCLPGSSALARNSDSQSLVRVDVSWLGSCLGLVIDGSADTQASQADSRAEARRTNVGTFPRAIAIQEVSVLRRRNPLRSNQMQTLWQPVVGSQRTCWGTAVGWHVRHPDAKPGSRADLREKPRRPLTSTSTCISSDSFREKLLAAMCLTEVIHGQTLNAAYLTYKRTE